VAQTKEAKKRIEKEIGHGENIWIN
jgi:hypothetical protein